MTSKEKPAAAAKTAKSVMGKYTIELFGGKDLRQAVKTPDGEDHNEWLAVHTVDFFNLIQMLWGVVTEFCTKDTCPVMSAGPKYEYHWADGTNKKPVKVSAPDYVDFLFQWVQKQLDDEVIFPSKIGVPFPKDFDSIVKNIFKRLFRVYAHLYHSHLAKLAALGADAHLNTCFKHFIFFVQEHKLVEDKDMLPLSEKIKAVNADDP